MVSSSEFTSISLTFGTECMIVSAKMTVGRELNGSGETGSSGLLMIRMYTMTIRRSLDVFYEVFFLLL